MFPCTLTINHELSMLELRGNPRGLPDLGFNVPDPWFNVPEDERANRIKLDADLCVIDDQEFYIRGVVQIPILDCEQTLGIGVWVSQKEENFRTYIDNYDSSEI